jgi:hypothetical protein
MKPFGILTCLCDPGSKWKAHMRKLPFNACDYRCERCLETANCAVFIKLRDYSLLEEFQQRDESGLGVVLEAIRESFKETESIIRKKAIEHGIDIDEIAAGPSADGMEGLRRSIMEDGLYRRSTEFTEQTRLFLQAADPVVSGPARDYYDDIVWHHTIIPPKLFRALSWGSGGEVALDGRTSAAVAMKSLTICIMAFDYLASRYPLLDQECRKLSADGARIKEETRKRFKPGNAG